MAYALWMIVWQIKPFFQATDFYSYPAGTHLSGFSGDIGASTGFRPCIGSRISLPDHLSIRTSYALTVTGHISRNKQKKMADDWARLVFMHHMPQSRKRAPNYGCGTKPFGKHFTKLSTKALLTLVLFLALLYHLISFFDSTTLSVEHS